MADAPSFNGASPGGIFTSCTEIFILTLIGSPCISILCDFLMPSSGGAILFWALEGSLILGIITLLFHVLALTWGKTYAKRMSIHRAIAEAYLGSVVMILATLVTSWIVLMGSVGNVVQGAGGMQNYIVSPWTTFVQASVGEGSWSVQTDGNFHSGTELSGPSSSGVALLGTITGYIIVMAMVACFSTLSASSMTERSPLVLDPTILFLTNTLICSIVVPGVYTGYGRCGYPVGFAVFFPIFALVASIVFYLLRADQNGVYLFLVSLVFHITPPAIHGIAQALAIFFLDPTLEPAVGTWAVVLILGITGIMMEFLLMTAKMDPSSSIRDHMGIQQQQQQAEPLKSVAPSSSSNSQPPPAANRHEIIFDMFSFGKNSKDKSI